MDKKDTQMDKILITGGSGMVGMALSKKLLAKGYQVAHLSTRKNYTQKDIETYYWNTAENHIDEEAVTTADCIIHLAGAGIADARWTAKRKEVIISSRVDTANLLTTALEKHQHKVHTFIGASAIGYYGDRADEVLIEETHAGSDFLAEVCEKWEQAYEMDSAIRQAVIRIGVVLAKEGGALPEMTKTLPVFVGVLGNGKQYYSWIHIDDLVDLFVFAIENKKVKGTYNAVAPHALPQKELAKIIAKHKGTVALPAPELALHFVLGEMKRVVLNSQRCSAAKIQQEGFAFTYSKAKDAIEDLL